MSFLVRHLLDIVGHFKILKLLVLFFFERTHVRHHNNRRKTRTYWTLRVKRVYWLDTYMYKTLNVSNALHLSVPQTLKSALLIDTLNVLVFYWAERVRHWDWLVLVGWTLVSHLDPMDFTGSTPFISQVELSFHTVLDVLQKHTVSGCWTLTCLLSWTCDNFFRYS